MPTPQPVKIEPGVMTLSLRIPGAVFGTRRSIVTISGAVPNIAPLVLLSRKLASDRKRGTGNAGKKAMAKPTRRIAERVFATMPPREQDFAILAAKLLSNAVPSRAPSAADVGGAVERIHVRSVLDDTGMVDLETDDGQALYHGYANDGRSEVAASVVVGENGGDALRVFRSKEGGWQKIHET